MSPAARGTSGSVATITSARHPTMTTDTVRWRDTRSAARSPLTTIRPSHASTNNAATATTAGANARRLRGRGGQAGKAVAKNNTPPPAPPRDRGEGEPRKQPAEEAVFAQRPSVLAAVPAAAAAGVSAQGDERDGRDERPACQGAGLGHRREGRQRHPLVGEEADNRSDPRRSDTSPNH